MCLSFWEEDKCWEVPNYPGFQKLIIMGTQNNNILEILLKQISLVLIYEI